MCPIYFYKMERIFTMKKLKMTKETALTFEEGCNKYLENCRQRNLREDTIRHYKDAYVQFKKYFSAEMLLSEMTEKKYQEYVLYLKNNLGSHETVRTYVRSLRTVFYFLMREGYMQPFKIKEIKADHHAIETYTDDELAVLLKKPNIKKCRFLEYQAWVMTNFLFTTGIRQRILI